MYVTWRQMDTAFYSWWCPCHLIKTAAVYISVCHSSLLSPASGPAQHSVPPWCPWRPQLRVRHHDILEENQHELKLLFLVKYSIHLKDEVYSGQCELALCDIVSGSGWEAVSVAQSKIQPWWQAQATAGDCHRVWSQQVRWCPSWASALSVCLVPDDKLVPGW